jgi:hypothetical protein
LEQEFGGALFAKDNAPLLTAICWSARLSR